MATTTWVNGKDLGLYIGGTLVSYGVGCSISGSANMINVTNKDSSGYQQVMPDEKALTLSFNGKMRFDAAYGAEDIITAWMAGTKVTAKYGNAETGDFYLQVDGYISDFELTADYGDSAVFSFTITSDGTLTKADNA